LAASLPLRFTQPLGHIVVPPGHLHALPAQLVPPVHELPQEPQLPLSFVVLTQVFVVSQYVVFPVTGHAGTHFVPSHETLPPPPGAVHAVQLDPHAFVSLATQLPSEQVCLGLVHWQPLPTQSSPAGHACPHEPQLAESFEKSAHPPAHGL
jgi:hypothetical protein